MLRGERHESRTNNLAPMQRRQHGTDMEMPHRCDNEAKLLAAQVRSDPFMECGNKRLRTASTACSSVASSGCSVSLIALALVARPRDHAVILLQCGFLLHD